MAATKPVQTFEAQKADDYGKIAGYLVFAFLVAAILETALASLAG
jgi:hypothetical protein